MDRGQESREVESGRLRVLVVEDDPSIKELMTIVLEKDWHDVVAFESGEDALEALKQVKNDHGYDVVITDQGLKGSMKGTDLIVRIRQEKLGNPFIIMVTGDVTSITDNFTPKQLAQMDIHRLRQKPFGPVSLREEITRAQAFKLQQKNQQQGQ